MSAIGMNIAEIKVYPESQLTLQPTIERLEPHTLHFVGTK